MAGYLRTAGVSAKLHALATAHPGIAEHHDWKLSREGKSAGYVKIGVVAPSSPDPRWAVLITGGVHARELAPPDALVSFIDTLLTCYKSGTGFSYPPFTGTDGVLYDAFTVSEAEIRTIVERLDLYVAPLVNPDGRDFVLTRLPASASQEEVLAHLWWRKNRAPAVLKTTDVPRPSDADIALSAGVDINRNFDILFKFEDHYDTKIADVHTSNDSRKDNFCGPSPESEPETQNVADLFRTKDIGFFLDVHSHSRDILYSWGIESNQNTDQSQSFWNTLTWAKRRDGTKHDTYAEYIPTSQEQAARDVATKMSQDILRRAGGSNAVARTRSTYKPTVSSNLYVTSGSGDDYCFSRWFTEARAGHPIRPIVAITMEAGGNMKPPVGHPVTDPPDPDNDDGGFWPNTLQYTKVEREIHAAVFSFLTNAAATPVSAPIAPPPPASKSSCLVATTVYHDGGHPSVTFLRDVRDCQLLATGPGRRFAARLSRSYNQASPGMAGWLSRHPAAARATRDLLEPSVQTLRAVSTRTARFPRARSVVLSAALAITVWPIVTVARAWHRAAAALRRNRSERRG